MFPSLSSEPCAKCDDIDDYVLLPRCPKSHPDLLHCYRVYAYMVLFRIIFRTRRNVLHLYRLLPKSLLAAAATIPAHSDGVEHMKTQRPRDPFKIKEENEKFRGLKFYNKKFLHSLFRIRD